MYTLGWLWLAAALRGTGVLFNLYLLDIPLFLTHMQCQHLYEQWRGCSVCCSACSSLRSMVKVATRWQSAPCLLEKDIQTGVLILSFLSSTSNTHTHNLWTTGNVGPIFTVPLVVFQIPEGLPPGECSSFSSTSMILQSFFLFPFSSGSQVGVVSARDPDSDPVSYYIDPGSINSNNFDINGTSGIIHTLRLLDREVCVYSYVIFNI